MKNRRGLIRMTALLVCLVMIGTLLPVMASAALAAPVLKGATADGPAIRVTWNAVSDAASYRVFRKTADSGWAALGNTTGTSYKDTTAQEKVTYTYTVRAVDSSGNLSDYDKIGVSAAWTQSTAGYTATPKLVSAKAESNGIRVTWGKVSGATGYRIYRKTESTGWKALADTGNVDNYLDKSVASGTKYIYTVRSLISGAVKSEYDTKGVSATWDSGIAPGEIAAPKLIGAVAEGAGIRVSWDAVSGASAYAVYRKTGSKSWAKLVDVKGTSYLDNATSAGEVYTYTVRCLNAAGEIISSYDKTGVQGSWTSPTPGSLATPILKSATSGVYGVVVKWNTVPGAAKYRIFRRTEGTSSWTGIGDSSTTAYTDRTAKGGTTYYYTVRAKDSSDNMASDYDRTGIKILYYAKPKLVSAESLANGIKVTWKASTGAKLYAIYRKTTGDFSRLGYSTGTSFTDKKVVEGKTYTYTVRVISEDKTTLLSEFDHTGISCKFIGKCAISSLENELNGVRIKWTGVAGAAKYKVMRKTGEGGWMTLKTVTTKSYLDGTAVNNTTHYYQVKALDSDGNVIGTYDANGVKITYYVAPTLTICVRANGGLTTTWEAVTGISNYVVLRKYGVGEWERVGTSGSTSYSDMTPPSGTFCWYTVQCADASGNPVSAYRTPGVGETSYMDKPVLKAAEVGKGKITISWNSVDKATNYRVYRKTGKKTSWDIVKSSTTALSFSDTDVMQGETYTYSVCVVKADGSEELSEFNTTGIRVTYYAPPTLTKIANGKTGVDLTWNAVDYVGSYHIYRKTGNDVDWVSVGTSTTTKFTDTSVKSNGHYTYAVRSMISGADASALSNTKDIIYYAAPKMTGISNGKNSITVTWKQESGINTYAVYRKIGSGSWTKIAEVSATTYTDTDSKTAGTKYSYAVKCVKDSKLVSAMNTAKTITYVAPVTGVKAVSAGTHKVKITWKTATGVAGYDVYRRSNGTSWTKVATVTGGSLTDTTPSEGTFIYYVVAIRDGCASAPSSTSTVTANINKTIMSDTEK